jgi:uncharacterized Tic20 family protein
MSPFHPANYQGEATMATDPAAGKPAPAANAGAAAPAGAETVPEIQSTEDERQMAMLAHWGGILPFFGIVATLGIWAMKMGQSPFVEDQAKESLNLQINVLMINILAAVSCYLYIGFVLAPAVWLINGYFCYMAGMAAKEGKVYRYPYTVRYIN